ncbi:hypothetical protein D9M72_611390 [compost metagenome]
MAEPFAVQGPALVFMQLTEPAVHAGASAPGIRAVDDVIMNQRCRLEKLQGGSGSDHLGGSSLSAGAAPAPVAHQCTQPLAAGNPVGDGAHQRINIL